MTGAQLHMSRLQLKFGSYCQVVEDATPCNSLAARMRGAISMGPSGNSSGGQRFLPLDTGKNDCPELMERTSHALGCYQPCQFAWSCQTFFIGIH